MAQCAFSLQKAQRAAPPPATPTPEGFRMYNEEEAARPYARALAQAAAELGMMARARSDMEALDAQWHGSPELREWCRTFHSAPRAEHRAFVSEVWGDTFCPPVRTLLEALSENGLLAALPQVIRVFRRLADRAEGRVSVALVFAAEPTRATLDALTAKARAAYGPAADIRAEIDPRLGAGLIVRAGHLQIDGSLAGRLRRLRRAFACA